MSFLKRSYEKLNFYISPDGRENPPDFSSGDWNDSGNELDEKAKTSAPK